MTELSCSNRKWLPLVKSASEEIFKGTHEKGDNFRENPQQLRTKKISPGTESPDTTITTASSTIIHVIPPPLTLQIMDTEQIEGWFSSHKHKDILCNVFQTINGEEL